MEVDNDAGPEDRDSPGEEQHSLVPVHAAPAGLLASLVPVPAAGPLSPLDQALVPALSVLTAGGSGPRHWQFFVPKPGVHFRPQQTTRRDAGRWMHEDAFWTSVGGAGLTVRELRERLRALVMPQWGNREQLQNRLDSCKNAGHMPMTRRIWLAEPRARRGSRRGRASVAAPADAPNAERPLLALMDGESC